MKRQVLVAVLVTWCACTRQEQQVVASPRPAPPDAGPRAPTARKEAERVTLHGDERVDEYAWLKKKSPEVEALLRAENAYTDQVLAPLEPLRATLKAEFKARRPQRVDDPGFVQDGWRYFRRSELDKPFEALLRQNLDAGYEELVVDLNVEFPKEKYARFGPLEVSDDGQRVAWSVDLTGGRDFTLRVRELDGGADWPQVLTGAAFGAFAADSRTLFYSTDNEAKRMEFAWRLDPGADAGTLLVDEKDERFGVRPGRSADRSEVQLVFESLTTTEVRVLDAKKPKGTFETVWPRVDGRRYELEPHGADWVLLVHEKLGDEGHVVLLPKKKAKAKPVELVAHRDGEAIDLLQVFKSHLVVWSRPKGQLQARIVDWKSHAEQLLQAPGQTLSPGAPDGYDSPWLVYEVESPVQPRQVLQRHLTTGETKPRWSQTVIGFDPAAYETFEVTATAKDGTKIPITIARKKGTPQTGGPLVLYGYGSYGISLDPWFNPLIVSLFDRGVTWAVAHVRGGGEFGDPWHQGGRMATKTNTFTDFIACAEHLIAEKYTSPERLVINGGSAGGLLMGVVLNQRPELFKAALVEVPFVDVISTMLDTSLPLTVEEFEEWGNPTIAEQYGWMRAYSPYENVQRQRYPDILVRSGYNDSQVLFHEPTKWVQRLRERRTDSGQTLLWMSMESGHSGKSNLDDQYGERARLMAWELSELGVRH